MVVTVSMPLPGQPLGPGTIIQARTSLESLPVGSYWGLFVSRTPDLWVLSAGSNRQMTHDTTMWPGVFVQETGTKAIEWYEQPPALADPQTAELTVQVRDVADQVLDTLPVPVVWKPDVAAIAWLQNLQRTQVVNGGFTAADRAELQVVKQSVSMDVGGGIIRGVIDTIGGLPPNFLQRVPIEPPRTGSGTLTRPAGNLSTAANGLAWEVTNVAPGIGIDEGAPDRLELVGLELRYVLTLSDGFTFTANHVATQERFGAWPWGFVTPSRVDYWIVPGVTVQFSWLVPTGTPFWQGDPATLPFLHHPMEPIQLGR